MLHSDNWFVGWYPNYKTHQFCCAVMIKNKGELSPSLRSKWYDYTDENLKTAIAETKQRAASWGFVVKEIQVDGVNDLIESSQEAP